ncbi:MAG: flagellar hook-associated protein FlgL [Pseudomonadota bacterium]
MRISTQQIHAQALNQMLDVQRQTADTQQQIATGRKYATAADDPLAAVGVERLNRELAVREQYEKNIDLADSELRLEESTLDQAMDLLQRVRELAVQAGNPVTSAEDRGFIATEVESRLDELMDVMNTRLASGDYLFGGTAGGQPPFVRDAGGAVRYQGDEGQRAVQIDGSTRLPVNDSGQRVFMDVASNRTVATARAHPGNGDPGAAVAGQPRTTDQQALESLAPDGLVVEFQPLADDPGGLPNYTVRRRSDGRVVDGLENVRFEPGAAIEAGGVALDIQGQPRAGDRFLVETSEKQDVLTTVSKLAEGLRSLSASGEDADAYQTLLGDTYTNLDNAMASILEAEAEIGARMNVMESVREQHAEVKELSTDLKSDLEDVDFAKAISDLDHQTVVLEAAQQSFMRISRLSLFDAI